MRGLDAALPSASPPLLSVWLTACVLCPIAVAAVTSLSLVVPVELWATAPETPNNGDLSVSIGFPRSVVLGSAGATMGFPSLIISYIYLNIYIF